MNAIRIRKKLEEDIPQLPELRPFLGKTVELIVLEEEAVPEEPLETEATFFGLAPPVPSPEEQAAHLAVLRQMAETDPRLAAFLKARDDDVLDTERIIQNRGRQ